MKNTNSDSLPVIMWLLKKQNKNFCKSQSGFPNFSGFIFANIHSFEKNLASSFNFPNTKALQKFEFICLMSNQLSQTGFGKQV